MDGFVYIYMNPLTHLMMLISLGSTVRAPTYRDEQGAEDEDQTKVAKNMYVYHFVEGIFSLMRTFGCVFTMLKEFGCAPSFEIKNFSRSCDIALMIMTAITIVILCQN